MIRVNKITKYYEGSLVFKDLSLNLDKTTFIMGESGIGKTTLLNILLGLETYDSGTIIRPENLKLSAVFQEDCLCENLSAFLNIKLPQLKNKNIDEEIKENLRFLNLDTDKPVRTFSAGMKRRVAILRGLMYDFDMIIFDEALRGLDEKNKLLVVDLIKKYTKNKLVIWVSHDISETKFFDTYNFIDLNEYIKER